MSVSPIDPTTFDEFVRSNYFETDEKTGAVDATKFFKAFARVNIQFVKADVALTTTNQKFIPGVNPLDRVLTWHGYDDGKVEIFALNAAGDGTMSHIGGIDSLYNVGGYVVTFTDLLPRGTDNVDPSKLLLRVTTTLKPQGTVVDPTGSIRVYEIASPVRTFVGYVQILGIPPLVYHDYVKATSPHYMSTDSTNRLNLTIQPSNPPVVGKAWIGIVDATNTKPVAEIQGFEWALYGYMFHKPGDQLIYQAPTSGDQVSVLNWDLTVLPPAFYKAYILDGNNNVLHGPLNFNSSQPNDVLPTFDTTRTIANQSLPNMAVETVATSSTEYAINTYVWYQHSNVYKDRIVIRSQRGVNKDVVWWGFVSHAPGNPQQYVPPTTPPGPNVSAIVGMSTLDGLDQTSLKKIGLQPDYYSVQHVNGNGVTIASAEIYSGLSIAI